MIVSRKMKIFFTLLICVLFLTAGSTSYIYGFKPIKDKISNLQKSIESEKTLIEKYEQGKVDQTDKNVNTVFLQKKIPVIEGVDQLLLMLEEAEVVSESLIRNISFSDPTEVTEENGSEIEQTMEELSNTGKIQKSSESDKNTEKAEQDPLPEGLERITARLTVEAKDYFALESFVRKIEEFERIINVESLDFSGFEEISNLDDISQNDRVLTYNIVISTYFFPKLEEFKDQAPKYEPEDPAEKKNPLYQGEIPDLKETAAISTSTTIDNNEKYTIYTVKEDETLFDIAIHFYNSNEGMQKIRDANGMTNNKILAGQQLIIPLEEE